MKRSWRVLRVGVALVDVLIGALALTTVFLMYRDTLAEQRAGAWNLALAAGRTIEVTVETLDYALKVAVDEIEHQAKDGRLDPAEVTRFLARQQAYFPHVDRLWATDSTGTALFGAGLAPGRPAHLARRPYVLALRANPGLGMVIGEPVREENAPAWIWPMARRINTPDGSFAGLAEASVRIDTLVARLDQHPHPPGTEIAVRDAAWRLIASTAFGHPEAAAPGTAGLPPGLAAALAAAPDGGTSEETDSDEAGPRLTAYHRETRFGLLVTATVPMGDALARWRWQSGIILGLTGLLLAGSFVFIRLLERRWNQVLLERQSAAHEEERAFLKALIQTIPNMIWLKDPNGIYLACNTEFEMFFGKPEDEIIGHTDYDFIDRDLAEFFRANDRAAMEAGEPTVNEEWITYAIGGRRALLKTTKTPMRTTDGTVIGVLGIAHDITETRRQEEALRESRETLARAQAVAHVGSWTLDIPTGRLDWSEETFRIFSLAPGGPLDLDTFRACVPPEDRDTIRAAWAAALAGTAPYDIEHRIIGPDGLRWVREQAVVERDPDGTARRGIGTAQDITERKTAQLALEEERRVRETIIDAMPGIVFALDESGRLIFWNRKLEQVSGRTAERLHHTDAIDLFEADRRAYVAERIGTAFAAGEATAEVDLIDGDGRRIPYMVTGRRIEIGGRPIQVGAAIDISARRSAEEALRQLNAELERRVAEKTADLRAANRSLLDIQFAMESVGIGITWADFESGRFIYANRFAADFLGYSHEELLHLRVCDVDEDFPIDAFREIREVIRRQGHVQIETTQRTRDGRRVPVELNIYYHPGTDGDAPRLIAFQSDISQRQEAKAALLHAKEAAEAANQAKSAFLANMSHEIRTPLNAILGLSYLLRRDPLTAQQSQRLDKMDVAGRHLLSIINDILDLSKIEAGGFRLESGNFHLSAVLDNVASIIRDSCIEKGLKLEVDAGGVPVWLRGDALRLRQALLNLAGNAVKFTPSGHIHLRAAMDHGDDDQAVWVRFEVEDTGIGLSAEQQSRLFMPFEQADGSTARRFGGTGLGLALTKRLTELMGGRIGVDSRLGQGSTFWFCVPLQRGHGAVPDPAGTAAQERAETRLRRACRGRRVLLADDNPVNVEVVQQMLHVVGLDVMVATDGRAAVDRLARDGADLILMDVQMPGVNGLDATRQIRGLPGHADTPILALTANAFAEDRAACLAAGMNEIITKPVTAATLYETLLSWLPPGGPAEAEATPALAGRAERLPGEAPTAVEGSPPTDPAVLAATLDGLERLLERDDMAALDYLDAHAGALRVACGPAFPIIAEQTRMFAMDAALATVRSIR